MPAWSSVVEVNVLNGVRLARRLLNGMLQRGWGRILFISSRSGVSVASNMLHYGTTKAATIALSNGLAKLTRGTGVIVNSILGGPTYSDGVADTIEAIATTKEIAVDAAKADIFGHSQTTLLECCINPEEVCIVESKGP